MPNLKEVRKEAREYLLTVIHSRSQYGIYICYMKGKTQFYFSEHSDGNEVFRLNKNGSLEKIFNTDHARNFHNELKRRRKLRKQISY